MIHYKESTSGLIIRARLLLGEMKKREKSMSAHDIELCEFYKIKQKHMRAATVEDHRLWVLGYLSRRDTRIDFDHSGCYFPTDKAYVITSDIDYIPKLCGSSSIILIVPKDIKVPRQDDYGHSSILLMDGFEKLNGYCEIYKETLEDV